MKVSSQIRLLNKITAMTRPCEQYEADMMVASQRERVDILEVLKTVKHIPAAPAGMLLGGVFGASKAKLPCPDNFRRRAMVIIGQPGDTGPVSG